MDDKRSAVARLDKLPNPLVEFASELDALKQEDLELY